MKLNKSLKLIGLLGTITLAVGCSGPTEKPVESGADTTNTNTTMPAKAPSAGNSMGMDMDNHMESSSTSYEVNKGDHLWGISGSSYGNPYQWPLIYKANSDKIKDADLIYPGQVLDIESNPSDSDSAAAISHAKSRGSWSIGITEESDKAYLSQ